MSSVVNEIKCLRTPRSWGYARAQKGKRIAERRRGSLWQDLKCSKIFSFFVVHRLDTLRERALGLPNSVVEILIEGVTVFLELFEFDHNGLLEAIVVEASHCGAQRRGSASLSAVYVPCAVLVRVTQQRGGSGAGCSGEMA